MRNAQLKKTALHIFSLQHVWNIILAVTVLAVVISYLMQINKTTVLGFYQRELEDKKSALVTRSNDLQFEAAQYQSIKYIQEQLSHLPLDQVREVGYVEVVLPEAVAIK